MSYEVFLDEVRHVLGLALASLGQDEEIVLEVPPNPWMGDIATTVAFALAKKTRQKPAEVAKQILKHISVDLGSMIDHVETAGPYLNFFIKTERVVKVTIEEIMSRRSSYGSSDLGKGKRILIEHTNVNPNKAIHIGHARNTCLGDSLVRIMRFTGHDVQAANYIDDTGTQVADVMLGFLALGLKPDPLEGMKFDQYCGDHVYARVNKMYDDHPELVEQRKKISKQIEEGNNEVAKEAKKITLRILKAQLETCWRIGAHFDLLNWETDILHSGIWHRAFERLKGTGLVVLEDKGELAGCWVAKVTELAEFAAETDAVLVRSNGTTTYLGKDVPYAMWKLGLSDQDFSYDILLKQPNGADLWTTTSEKGLRDHPVFGGADMAVSVIDVRQSRPQEILSTFMRLVAGKSSPKKYVHYAYEVVSLTPKTARDLGIVVSEVEKERRMLHMEGRRGLFVNVDTVMDALSKRAFAETRKRNPDASDDWVRSTAEKIATAAIRYNLTKVGCDKIIVFDMDEAVDLEGETGPYVQYAHVRACRILEKAGVTTLDSTTDSGMLSQHEEIILTKELARFPYVVKLASQGMSPQRITKYCYDLATIFNAFYEKCKVIGAEPEALEKTRLQLVDCTRVVLKNALALLGIDTPDRM
jgi:arginyl-tRNA synthetase